MPRSTSNETDLWKWLKPARNHYKLDLHMNRVENSVLSGMPDVEGCLSGNPFWVELKCSDRPVRSTTRVTVKFRPKQIPWMVRRANAGGRAFVLIQVGSGRRDASRYLIRPAHLTEVESGCTEERLSELSLLSSPKAKPVDIVGLAAILQADRYWAAGL